jgi:dihydropteroate synthase
MTISYKRSELLKHGRPLIMGIVNVTPDSFSDGGTYHHVEAAVAHARQLLTDGADILDIGGESTRPGSDEVSSLEECRRIIPVIEALRDLPIPVSVDTRHAQTMINAIEAGARIINDVTALSGDPDSLKVAARYDLPVILMHMKGVPKTMQDFAHYNNVMDEIIDYLAERIIVCEKNGIAKDRIIADPGIGFAKNLDHNLEVIRNVSQMHRLDVPVLIGLSRKRFINELCGVPDPLDRDLVTVIATLQTVLQGAQIVRVHNVAAMRQGLIMQDAITNQNSNGKVG